MGGAPCPVLPSNSSRFSIFAEFSVPEWEAVIREWEREYCVSMKRLGLDGGLFPSQSSVRGGGHFLLHPEEVLHSLHFLKKNIYLVRGWLGWVYRCHDVCVEVGGRRLGVSSLYCEDSRDQGQGIRLGSMLPAPWTFPNVPHCTFSCSPGLLAHQLVTDDYCYYWFESHLCHLPCLFLAILPKLSVLLMCK